MHAERDGRSESMYGGRNTSGFVQQAKKCFERLIIKVGQFNVIAGKMQELCALLFQVRGGGLSQVCAPPPPPALETPVCTI